METPSHLLKSVLNPCLKPKTPLLKHFCKHQMPSLFLQPAWPMSISWPFRAHSWEFQWVKPIFKPHFDNLLLFYRLNYVHSQPAIEANWHHPSESSLKQVHWQFESVLKSCPDQLVSLFWKLIITRIFLKQVRYGPKVVHPWTSSWINSRHPIWALHQLNSSHGIQIENYH